MSPEGVVLGADSTTSVPISTGPGLFGFHYLNHNQKLFQLGENSTVGVVTWGLGGLASASHRTLLGLLSDSIQSHAPADVKEIADRWATQFWKIYIADPLVVQFRTILNKQPYNPSNPTDPNARTEEEDKNIPIFTRNLFVGFIIAGYWLPDRTPVGFQIPFDPMSSAAPSPQPILLGNYFYAGAPNIIKRLINGADDNLKDSIKSSGKWTGNDADLVALLNQFILFHPNLPIRDAIDFVHSCIQSTIKALKFSNMFQVCGGPIELAVITSDRRFRWVRHKQWDSAIIEGGPS
jgi:hypothetical protein